MKANNVEEKLNSDFCKTLKKFVKLLLRKKIVYQQAMHTQSLIWASFDEQFSWKTQTERKSSQINWL